MKSSRSKHRKRKASIISSIRRPLAPPGHPLAQAKPDEKARPAGRKPNISALKDWNLKRKSERHRSNVYRAFSLSSQRGLSSKGRTLSKSADGPADLVA